MEYNSKDESGAYLDPADYPDIVLGRMELTDNAQGLIESILGGMGFGDGIGNWNPSLPVTPDSGEGEDPGQTPGSGEGEDPGQAPGSGEGEDPGQTPGSGVEDEQGSASETGDVKDPAQTDKAENTADVTPAQTGDTTDVLPYAAAALVSAAALIAAALMLRMRRR